MKRLAFAALAIILTIGILEIAARIVESAIMRGAPASVVQPGWQAEFFRSFFDWHEADPDLLWRFRANLSNPLIKTNSDHLLGDEIPKEKAPESFRILLIGDSSPVGLGLKSRRQAFGEVLKYQLDALYAGRKNIELVNASVSGYSSEQVARFLELRGWKYQPDLVLVYCGNNDASLSGIYSDQELLAAEKLVSVRKAMNHLALYRLLKSVMARGTSGDDGSTARLKLRSTPERYGENLSSIYRQCRSHNCPLIVLKPPVPRFWPAGLQFKIFVPAGGEEGKLVLPDEMVSILGRKLKYCLDPEIFRQIYGAGDYITRNVYRSAYNDSLSPVAAIAHYRGLLLKDSADPVLLNNLGVSFWQNRQYDSAEVYLKRGRESFVMSHPGKMDYALISAGSPFLFNLGVNVLTVTSSPERAVSAGESPGWQFLDSALENDYFSLRIKKDYWKNIDALGGQKGVTVVDLPALFAAHDGEKLFVDHCHPNAQGHQFIAEALAQQIKSLGYIH